MSPIFATFLALICSHQIPNAPLYLPTAVIASFICELLGAGQVMYNVFLKLFFFFFTENKNADESSENKPKE